MENQQKTGAFKFRGATFKLMQLTNEQLDKGVITASAGNHAQGVAYASRKLGVKATIYMPEKTPHAKVEATQNYGAEVVLTGSTFQEAYGASMERQEQTGATYVHPFDDYDVMAGQGTVAMEMLCRFAQVDPIKCLATAAISRGIAVKEPGKLTLPLIYQYVDDIVTVTEEEVASAILYMLERNKTLMEGAGAAALAALFAHNDF